MPHRRLCKVLALFASLVIFGVSMGGCVKRLQVYTGPPRADDEIAVIKGKRDALMSHDIVIMGVDDTLTLGDNLEYPGYHEVKILPGTRRIGITAYFGQNIWGDTRRTATAFVTLDAEAGHVYQLKAELLDDGAVNAWAEDVTRE